MQRKKYYSIRNYNNSRGVYYQGLFLGYITLDKGPKGWIAGIINTGKKIIIIDNEPKNSHKKAIEITINLTLTHPYFRKKLEAKLK